MFSNIYKDKKVLITGNTGFKGAWLTIWLLELEAKIYGYSNEIPTQPSLFESTGLEEKLEAQYFEDVRDGTKLTEVVTQIKPDFVFHLAAQPIVKLSYSDPVETFSTNVMGVVNIAEALRISNHPCTAIIITSDKCYDNVEWLWGYKETDALGGKDPYSASKGAAELVIKTYYHSYFQKTASPVRIATVRAGNVIGGGDWAANRLIPDCMRAWEVGDEVEIRSPKATRPWQHVLEPLSGYLRMGQILALSDKLNGEGFNFGPKASQDKTVQEILEKLVEYWTEKGNEALVTFIPNPNFLEAGLLKLNCDKALKELQWEANLDFEETAKFSAEWYYNFYHKDVDRYDLTLGQLKEYISLAKNRDLKWVQ